MQSVLYPGRTERAEVMPFWRAALGYEPGADTPDEDLVDPRSRGPSFWFEPTRPDGGRRLVVGDRSGAVHHLEL